MCIIYLESYTVISIFISTLESSIQGKMPLGRLKYLAVYSPTYYFSFFSVIVTKSLLLVFSYSNVSIAPIPWYSFLFCCLHHLYWVI